MNLSEKLRYMGRQYSARKAARGGGQKKHYLEEAADEIDSLRAKNAALREQAANALAILNTACETTNQAELWDLIVQATGPLTPNA